MENKSHISICENDNVNSKIEKEEILSIKTFSTRLDRDFKNEFNDLAEEKFKIQNANSSVSISVNASGSGKEKCFDGKKLNKAINQTCERRTTLNDTKFFINDIFDNVKKKINKESYSSVAKSFIYEIIKKQCNKYEKESGSINKIFVNSIFQNSIKKYNMDKRPIIAKSFVNEIYKKVLTTKDFIDDKLVVVKEDNYHSFNNKTKKSILNSTIVTSNKSKDTKVFISSIFDTIKSKLIINKEVNYVKKFVDEVYVSALSKFTKENKDYKGCIITDKKGNFPNFPSESNTINSLDQKINKNNQIKGQSLNHKDNNFQKEKQIDKNSFKTPHKSNNALSLDELEMNKNIVENKKTIKSKADENKNIKTNYNEVKESKYIKINNNIPKKSYKFSADFLQDNDNTHITTNKEFNKSNKKASIKDANIVLQSKQNLNLKTDENSVKKVIKSKIITNNNNNFNSFNKYNLTFNNKSKSKITSTSANYNAIESSDTKDPKLYNSSIKYFDLSKKIVVKSMDYSSIFKDFKNDDLNKSSANKNKSGFSSVAKKSKLNSNREENFILNYKSTSQQKILKTNSTNYNIDVEKIRYNNEQIVKKNQINSLKNISDSKEKRIMTNKDIELFKSTYNNNIDSRKKIKTTNLNNKIKTNSNSTKKLNFLNLGSRLNRKLEYPPKELVFTNKSKSKINQVEDKYKTNAKPKVDCHLNMKDLKLKFLNYTNDIKAKINQNSNNK